MNRHVNPIAGRLSLRPPQRHSLEILDRVTELVIHVNMLKEGWDVTNLYMIVPLRAANARTLIIAHDRFQEIVDEANKPDSAIRLTQVILDPATDLQKTRTVVAQSKIEEQLHGAFLSGPADGPAQTTPIFAGELERGIAQVAYKVM